MKPRMTKARFERDARGWYSTAYGVRHPLLPKRNGVLWCSAELDWLLAAYRWGASLSEIAADHQRKESAIVSRLAFDLIGHDEANAWAERCARHLNSQQHKGNSNESTGKGPSEVPSNLGRSARVSHSGMYPQP